MGPAVLPSTEKALAEVEAGAVRFLARFRGLQFRRAESPADKTAVYCLRCCTVLEQGWGTPDQFPAGIERDMYDDDAVHISVWDGHVLAAANRLVFPAPGRDLPTAAAYDLSPEAVRGAVDWSRTCVAPPYRGRHPEVLAGLMVRTWLELRAHGFTLACGVLNRSMQRLYRRMGFSVERLGAPRFHWGEVRHPVLVGPPHSVPRWLQQSPAPLPVSQWEERPPAEGKPCSKEEPACPAGSSIP
jgi:hypothetical protein